MSKMSKLERVESLLKDIKSNIDNSEVEDEEGVFYDREAYLSAFDETCERFGIEVELEEDGDSKDEVFSDWQDEVNMTASELQKWSKNPCSREASVDPEAVIKRNLRLLEKNKSDWTDEDVEDAKRTISFISRMKANRPDSPREGPHGCPSEWAISMLNWAFNPFDSVPTPSSESKEDLDPVEKVTLQERKNVKEAEMLAEHVWMMKDVFMEHGREFEDQAMRLEETKSVDEVEQIREGLLERVDVLNEKVDRHVSGIKEGSQSGEEEMSQSRKASEVVHGDEQQRMSDSDEGDGVRVPPVAIHKVDGGSSVQVEDEVEDVLDELWDENQED